MGEQRAQGQDSKEDQAARRSTPQACCWGFGGKCSRAANCSTLPAYGGSFGKSRDTTYSIFMFYCAKHIDTTFGGNHNIGFVDCLADYDYIAFGRDIGFKQRVDSQGEFDDRDHFEKCVDSQGEYDDGDQGEIACDLVRLRGNADRGPKSAMERLRGRRRVRRVRKELGNSGTQQLRAEPHTFV